LLLLSEAISLSASDFINESTAAYPADDGTSLILSAVLHELKLLTVKNNTWTRTTQCNQRDSVGIHSAPFLRTSCGFVLLGDYRPFLCRLLRMCETEAGRSKGMK
jgi:hypothetical protein